MEEQEILQIAELERPSKKKRIWLVLVIVLFLLLAVEGTVLLFLKDPSPYMLLKMEGYKGTKEQLIASLVGEMVDKEGSSAYTLACENGFDASASRWNEILTGTSLIFLDKTTYEIASEHGFKGNEVEWLSQIVPNPEKLGYAKIGKEPTQYEMACQYGYEGTFIEWLISVTHDKTLQ